jgi:AhpD family alkylhydroperoxidase
VLEYAAAGILPGAIERNKESCGDRVICKDLPEQMLDICFDAQTSGGLLIALPSAKASQFVMALHRSGVQAAAVIGQATGKGKGLVHVETTGTRKIPSGIPAAKQAAAEKTASQVPCCADAVQVGTSDTDKSGLEAVRSRFVGFLTAASTPYGMDAYTKQAIAIALSVALRCEPCLKMHIKKAKAKGFTQQEIDEAAWMGISFAGSPAMVFYEGLRSQTS